jgi:hypothetical protein
MGERFVGLLALGLMWGLTVLDLWCVGEDTVWDSVAALRERGEVVCGEAVSETSDGRVDEKSDGRVVLCGVDVVGGGLWW